VIAAAAAGACPAARERIVAPLRSITGCDGASGEQPLMVVHVNSSSTYPLRMANMFNDGGAWRGAPGVLPGPPLQTCAPTSPACTPPARSPS
jgi:hypothetical protein